MKGNYERLIPHREGEREFEICLLAALDYVSTLPVTLLSYAVRLQTFRRYRSYQLSMTEVERITRDQLNVAGHHNHHYLKFIHVSDSTTATKVFSQARQIGERIIAYTQPGHVMGFCYDTESQVWRTGGSAEKPRMFLESEIINALLPIDDPKESNVIVLGPEIYSTISQVPQHLRSDSVWQQRTNWLARQVYTLTGVGEIIRDTFRARR